MRETGSRRSLDGTSEVPQPLLPFLTPCSRGQGSFSHGYHWLLLSGAGAAAPMAAVGFVPCISVLLLFARGGSGSSLSSSMWLPCSEDPRLCGHGCQAKPVRAGTER